MLSLAIAVPIAGGAPRPTPADEKAQQAELDRVKSRIEALKQDLDRDRGQQDSLKTELDAAEKSIADAATVARDAGADVQAQKGRVDVARRERQKASQRLAERRRQLSLALRAVYTADAPTRLQAMFEVDRLAAMDRVDVDTASVAGALARRVTEVRARIGELRLAEADLRRALTELDARQKREQAALAQLRSAQEERKTAKEKLDRRVADKTAQRKEAEAEQARVEKLLADLRKALRASPDMKFEAGTPFARQRGRMPWPLRGKLLARFGEAKAGGRLSWNGWWIAAQEGDPVRAVADARVVYVGQVQRYGLVVILDHAGDYLTLYGQLESSSAKVGKVVQAGDTIAAAGTSGGHEQAGVYFEIRQGTTPVDPKSWLAP